MKKDDTVVVEGKDRVDHSIISSSKVPHQYNGEVVLDELVKVEDDNGKKVYIESYGCQMNFSDSEIVASILAGEGFTSTSDIDEADIVLLNTCSIRDKAEQTIYNRLSGINGLKEKKGHLLIGLLGCMAERLKRKLLEEDKVLDLVVGPDSYRDLPRLITHAYRGEEAVNTFLSREETYADISPVRLHSNGVTAFISIMRGCDNMCSFCVVPFTRGRERSRNPYSIVAEATDLFQKGYREVTLLGQNVDSYKWSEEENSKVRLNKKGISEFVSFADLLEMVARVHPDLRVRFSTSNPRDLTDEVLHTIARYENICNFIHLPVQSGNDRILQLMNRGYTRGWYINRVNRIREIIGPEVGISSDIIAGFCSETEAEHQDTLDLMDAVGYDFSYMFCYSERPGTVAAKKMQDDVPKAVKKRRLKEIIAKQNRLSLSKNQSCIGRVYKVLIEGPSRRSDAKWQGRNTANKVVVFPKRAEKIGHYVNVLVEDCTGATLLGNVIE